MTATQRLTTRKPTRRRPTKRYLNRLAKRAEKLAIGVVKKVRLDKWHVAYIYTRWASDTSADVYLLGVTPTKRVSDYNMWKEYFQTYTRDLLEGQIRDAAFDLADEYTCYIQDLCREFDDLSEFLSDEEFCGLEGEVLHNLDPNTRGKRTYLYNGWVEYIKKEQGILLKENLSS